MRILLEEKLYFETEESTNGQKAYHPVPRVAHLHLIYTIEIIQYLQ
jgi:hypothetical protein